MSRRHHGGRPHRPGGHHRQPSAPAAPPAEQPRPRPDKPIVPQAAPIPDEPAGQRPHPAARPHLASEAAATPAVSRQVESDAAPATPSTRPPPLADRARPNGGPPPQAASGGCTAPQLRRFIKSRPYVPMHELRRRFGINGADDDVTAVDLADGRIYVGLPAREGSLVGELLRSGDIGCELSLDPRTPIVVGLYPMRPVPRG
jgi:hypothetical protein